MINYDKELDRFLQQVAGEVKTAQRKHPPLNSHHEAYAVLLEEVEEYWELVRLKESAHDALAMRRELIQIAAMAARAATDVRSGRKVESAP